MALFKGPGPIIESWLSLGANKYKSLLIHQKLNPSVFSSRAMIPHP